MTAKLEADRLHKELVGRSGETFHGTCWRRAAIVTTTRVSWTRNSLCFWWRSWRFWRISVARSALFIAWTALPRADCVLRSCLAQFLTTIDTELFSHPGGLRMAGNTKPTDWFVIRVVPPINPNGRPSDGIETANKTNWPSWSMDPTKRAVEPSRRSSKRVFPRYKSREAFWCCGNTATIPDKKLLLSTGRLQNKNGQNPSRTKSLLCIFSIFSPNRKGTETISIDPNRNERSVFWTCSNNDYELYNMMHATS